MARRSTRIRDLQQRHSAVAEDGNGVNVSECVRGDSGRNYIDHSEKNGGSGRNSVLRVVQ